MSVGNAFRNGANLEGSPRTAAMSRNTGSVVFTTPRAQGCGAARGREPLVFMVSGRLAWRRKIGRDPPHTHADHETDAARRILPHPRPRLCAVEAATRTYQASARLRDLGIRREPQGRAFDDA